MEMDTLGINKTEEMRTMHNAQTQEYKLVQFQDSFYSGMFIIFGKNRRQNDLKEDAEKMLWWESERK